MAVEAQLEETDDDRLRQALAEIRESVFLKSFPRVN
jgi:hypothetical protein